MTYRILLRVLSVLTTKPESEVPGTTVRHAGIDCLSKGSNTNATIVLTRNLSLNLFKQPHICPLPSPRKEQRGKVIKDCIRKQSTIVLIGTLPE